MKPGFILNCHSREKNPLFESHDPSMMWDEVSGYYYSYSTDTVITSKYRQGIPVRRSRNLVDFEFVGYALSPEAVAEGRDNDDFPPTGGFWAPYVEKWGDEYRMYYSATRAFGSSESRIWLAVSRHPEGPFENRGVVMDTWETPDTDPNAIDAHVIDDSAGRKYLVYGSFFGGIFIKELNPATGLALNCDVKYQGKCIAKKPTDSAIDGPEGAAVIYGKETGYYYLFLSYGWLGDDYDIRVGRSRSPEGPYLDYQGKDLKGQCLGTKLAGSYRFSAANPCADREGEAGWAFGGFRGPGHGVPFYDPVSSTYFFVHHVRDGAEVLKKKKRDSFGKDSYRMHYMAVRRMFFIEGWPVFSPEPYAGESGSFLTYEEWEKAEDQSFCEDGRRVGKYIGEKKERKEDQKKEEEQEQKEQEQKEQEQKEQEQKEQEQKEQEQEEQEEQEKDDHRAEKDFMWEWIRFLPGDNRQVTAVRESLPGNMNKQKLLVFPCYDFENSQETIGLSGLTEDGCALWGKAVFSDILSYKASAD